MKLKPCPWCGEVPEVVEDSVEGTWAIYCDSDNCAVLPCLRYQDSKEDGCIAWNERKDDEDFFCPHCNKMWTTKVFSD